jgi:hypothetical protein
LFQTTVAILQWDTLTQRYSPDNTWQGGVAMKILRIAALAPIAWLAVNTQAAMAEKAPPPSLAKCSASLGTVALVDGDQAGWTKYGLGSPRELLNAMAIESGCFTPKNPASNEPVRFLINAIAGDKEEVDKGIEAAKGAAMEGLVRSGAVGGLARSVPGAGMLGMFGGLGGKKKTFAAGLRVISPQNGMTIASGTGSVTKSSLTFGGAGGLAAGAASSGYGNSKDGQALAEAFMIAFNGLVAQETAIAATPQMAAAPAAPALATVAVDSALRSAPVASGALVRTLRAGTTLTPTGKREGLFIEVADNFGTKGWVSVEDLK